MFDEAAHKAQRALAHETVQINTSDDDGTTQVRVRTNAEDASQHVRKRKSDRGGGAITARTLPSSPSSCLATHCHKLSTPQLGHGGLFGAPSHRLQA